jgi:hypothetical protein
VDVDVDAGEDAGKDTVFGAMQKFFSTGRCGAMITTIVASIAWQLVTSAFPIAFLSNPFTYIFLRMHLSVFGDDWLVSALRHGFSLGSTKQLLVSSAHWNRRPRNVLLSTTLMMQPIFVWELDTAWLSSPALLRLHPHR